MDGFKFPLQKLLDIRKDKEEQSKIGFMEAQREKNLSEDRLNSLKETYDMYRNNDKNMSVAERKMRSKYLVALSSGIETANRELMAKNKNLDIKRDELKEKQIERKTVEIIKDKRFDNFKREEARKEQVQNDEFALYSFVRRTERG